MVLSSSGGLSDDVEVLVAVGGVVAMVADTDGMEAVDDHDVAGVGGNGEVSVVVGMGIGGGRLRRGFKKVIF